MIYNCNSFLCLFQQYFDACSASCPTSESCVNAATGPKCIKTGQSSSYVYILGCTYMYGHLLVFNLLVKCRAREMRNTHFLIFVPYHAHNSLIRHCDNYTKLSQ